MNEKSIKLLRETTIKLLDDGEGINEVGYVALTTYAAIECPGFLDDIFALVGSGVTTNNGGVRYFLPEEHSLIP